MSVRLESNLFYHKWKIIKRNYPIGNLYGISKNQRTRCSTFHGTVLSFEFSAYILRSALTFYFAGGIQTFFHQTQQPVGQNGHQSGRNSTGEDDGCPVRRIDAAGNDIP